MDPATAGETVPDSADAAPGTSAVDTTAGHTARDPPAPGAAEPAAATGPEAGTRAAEAAAPPETGAAGDRRIGPWALALVLLPLAVSAIALVVAVGGDYLPSSDHALTELQVRDAGRHPVVVGLYSRANWNHPGPLLFYLLAPFYWLTGGSSIGMSIGTLAINGASVAGMALVARRRGGTSLMLCTLLGCALLMRTLGAEFLHDPWNCFVTVLPFGLMVFLAWAMACGDPWALPVGAGVGSFLAQTHVGYVALALPLLAWGAGCLVLDAGRGTAGGPSRPALRRAGLASAVVLGVLWLPAAIDAVIHAPSNTRKVIQWFTSGEEGAHTLAEGWRVITGQFAWPPEWLTTKRTFAFGGESPFLASSPLPWLLVPVVVAGVLLWRRGDRPARRLVLTLAVTGAFGVLAVARTLGAAFDYRLRWTWVPAMAAGVMVAWTGWLVAARRWPRASDRALVPIAVAALAVLAGVNVTTAATVGVPQAADSEVLAELMPGVLDAVEREGHDEIVVSDLFASGAWYARGIVLQLERRGIDARVPAGTSVLFGEHRVESDDESPRTHLVVVMNDAVEAMRDQPDMELVAEWSDIPAEERSALEEAAADLAADVRAHRVTRDEVVERMRALDTTGRSDATASAVAVFLASPPRH